MGKGLAAPVTGGSLAQLTRRKPVVHQPDHDAVLDQDRARGRRPLIINGQGATPPGDGAVIDDGDARRGHALAHLAGKDRATLAVEVAFKAVTDCLVQQHAGPAGGQHHIHLSGRAIDCVQIDQGLAQGFIDLGLPALRRDPLFEPGPATGPGGGSLAAATLFDSDRDVQTHQRADVAQALGIATQNFDLAPLADNTGRDLHHARVAGAGEGVNLLQ